MPVTKKGRSQFFNKYCNKIVTHLEAAVAAMPKKSPCLSVNRNTLNYLSSPNTKDLNNSKRRSFTPMHSRALKTPDVSPIKIVRLDDYKENSPSFNFLVRCKK